MKQIQQQPSRHSDSYRRYFAGLLLLLILAGCASNPQNLSNPEQDPWENANRKIFKFNAALDQAIIRPVAKGYDKITPDPLQRGFGNFFRNLKSPLSIVNLALQGKGKQTAVKTGRFLLNSTFGLLGFFDVASKADIPDYEEDFGQTFAVWGWDSSRFVVLPFLGAATVRDGIGRVPGNYLDPVSYAMREHSEYVPFVVETVHLRADLLAQDSAVYEAYDPYLIYRDAFLQNREYDIYDGDPPVPDYDEYLLDEIE